MLKFFRLGLGSRIGSGRQSISWIHEKDLFHALLYLLEHKELDGAFNLTAPHPVSNTVLTQSLNQALNKKGWMPAIPAMFLRIMYGEFANTLVRGQRVFPCRLLDSGYKFQFPEINAALAEMDLR
jgi:NAD dependent epimerase/dehydratase family enzyme